MEKIVGKSAKIRFLYSHEYRDRKLAVKRRAKHFFEKYTNSALIKYSKKSSEKSAKKHFYIHSNIVSKQWGKKTREKFFPETHAYRDL